MAAAAGVVVGEFTTAVGKDGGCHGDGRRGENWVSCVRWRKMMT